MESTWTEVSHACFTLPLHVHNMALYCQHMSLIADV